MDADAGQAVALLDALVRSLHDESDALVAGDLERLNAASTRKNEALARLAPELKRIPDTQRRQHEKTLRAAQMLNERNARILAVRMTMNRARVDTLMHAAGAGLYAADGGVAGRRVPSGSRARA